MTSIDNLGLRIRMARRQQRLSQAGLAALLGVTRSAVANWECGQALPSMLNLQRLATALDVAFEWLASGWGTAHPADTPLNSEQMGTPLDAAERRLLQAFRVAPKWQQKHILHIALSLSATTAASLAGLLPFIGS